MTARAFVHDRATSAFDVLCNVRGKEECFVVALSPHCERWRRRRSLDHLHGRSARGGASGLCRLERGDQVKATFNCGVSLIGQPCWSGATFLLYSWLPGRWWRHAACCSVASHGCLCFKSITVIDRLSQFTVGLDAVLRGPRPDHWAIDDEVQVAQKSGGLDRPYKHLERFPRDIRSGQPTLVHPGCRVSPGPHITDRIDHREKRHSKEQLRCDRRSAGLQLQSLKLIIHMLRRIRRRRLTRVPQRGHWRPRLARKMVDTPVLLPEFSLV